MTCLPRKASSRPRKWVNTATIRLLGMTAKRECDTKAGIREPAPRLAGATAVRPVGIRGGPFVGIHFGGVPQAGIAYMFPAWLLFERKYFVSSLQTAF